MGGRWILALAYLLASLMATGYHVHDQDSARAPLENRGDCDESRPHVADHEVAAQGDAPQVCPSCQLRSQTTLLVTALKPVAGPSVLIPLAADRPNLRPGAPLRTRCRAPPLA